LINLVYASISGGGVKALDFSADENAFVFIFSSSEEKTSLSCYLFSIYSSAFVAIPLKLSSGAVYKSYGSVSNSHSSLNMPGFSDLKEKI
jgi:hypothetical protein